MTIDWWTLGFQAVNVAILIWLLGYFFWKPVAGMIDARRASAQRAGFARERDAILADAHKDAEAASAASLAKTKIDADSLEAGAKAAIAKDQKAQEGAWAERSAELAIDIAGRLATRLDSAVVQACFLEWLLGEIRELPELALKAAGAKDMKLEVASAVKLDAAERKSCAKVIAEAFGGDPHITFRTDRTLIAGFELHGEHLIVRSSWRADLAAIQADLAA
jgi:F-type H+-transporting ATPase subunit b